jgi:hypothetical protein
VSATEQVYLRNGSQDGTTRLVDPFMPMTIVVFNDETGKRETYTRIHGKTHDGLPVFEYDPNVKHPLDPDD